MINELEVIAFDINSCKIASENGADRIELCDNPYDGGTTPSYGMIAEARKISSIQLFPIIRPRGGDFLYSQEEFNVMLADIEICKKLNCNGVVIGMLNVDGSIDIDRCAKLIEAADSMDVTFHRAFDRVKDPFRALEEIISLGCKRILTSGLYPSALEGINMLKSLVQLANGRIRIMPGSGINANNILSLAEGTGAYSFHASARKKIDSTMLFQNESMRESLHRVTLDANEVKNMKTKLNHYFNSK